MKSVWLIAGALILGAVGCGPADTEGNKLVCPADPMDGAVPEGCGIWVSQALGDDANPGTQSAPVGTLKHAIELAEEAAFDGAGRVYACGGETWEEGVAMTGDVSLHGGFDCANSWEYVGSKMKTVIMAPPDEIGIRMTYGPQGGIANYLTDLHIQAANGVTPGSSSIGLYQQYSGYRLTVKRCTIIAGDGADGADGASGDSLAPPPKAGLPGSNGSASCSLAEAQGGAGLELECPDGVTAGGDGGGAVGIISAEDGANGLPLARFGGGGGWGATDNDGCYSGAEGVSGTRGYRGSGGRGLGDMGDLTYEAPQATDGEDGTMGQGGGGGGGALGSIAFCGSATLAGGGGGAGGTGGCGGKGGKGGGSGGASLAVASTGEIHIIDCELVSGRGGNGGNGGAPQLGAKGGAPGLGGPGKGNEDKGCDGGAGGHGARGGWGGGGAGGPSHCVATPSGPSWAPDIVGTSETAGTPGEGGLGDPGDSNHYGDGGDGQSGARGYFD